MSAQCVEHLPSLCEIYIIIKNLLIFISHSEWEREKFRWIVQKWRWCKFEKKRTHTHWKWEIKKCETEKKEVKYILCVDIIVGERWTQWSQSSLNCKYIFISNLSDHALLYQSKWSSRWKDLIAKNRFERQTEGDRQKRERERARNNSLQTNERQTNCK